MVLSDTELEKEFSKIHRKGAKITLAFFRQVLNDCSPEIRVKFENMIISENAKQIETTEEYKKVLAKYESIYVPNSVKSLNFIANSIKSYPDNILLDILKIIQKNNESFTEKKKETLVNLGSLKEETIQEIIKFILFIESSMEQLNNVSGKMSIIRGNFSDIDAIANPIPQEDPNYTPILHDYKDGPAPILEHKTT